MYSTASEGCVPHNFFRLDDIKPYILFDTGFQSILEYRWIVSYTQPSPQT